MKKRDKSGFYKVYDCKVISEEDKEFKFYLRISKKLVNLNIMFKFMIMQQNSYKKLLQKVCKLM